MQQFKLILQFVVQLIQFIIIMPSRHKKTFTFIQIICLIATIIPAAYTASKPFAIQPDPTYLTGTKTLFTTNMGSTSNVIYSVTYPWILSTSSLNATLSIMGVNFYLKGNQFGWRMSIISLTTSSMAFQVSVNNNNNPLFYLRIGYLVSWNSYLDLNFVSYTFSASDSINNYALAHPVCSTIFDCRKYNINQPYRSKTNGKVRTFLAGFDVDNMNGAANSTYFGISLDPSSTPAATSFYLTITVYGGAEISYISYFYVSFEPNTLNVVTYRTVMEGRSSLGCSYSSTTCNPAPNITVSPSSNSTFNTGGTSVLAYTQNMFLIGFDRLILNYAGDASTLGQFSITSLSQNSDTSIKVNFAFNGNTDNQFHVAFSFFTLQTFYCSASSPDPYYVYNSNTCDNNCNGTIQQFVNATNYCQLCGPLCWRCSGASTFCISCYTTQNRILSGNQCVCDVNGGAYDDNSSNICPLCDVTCKTCFGGGAANCLSCDSASNRVWSSNTCACLTGYYNNGGAICQPCYYYCLTATCSGGASTNCASCNPSKYRILLSNYSCGCMTGYYDNNTSTQKCSQCHYSCVSCWGTNLFCTACDGIVNFRFLNTADNTCRCFNGYYDTGNASCLSCHSTCITCNGPSANNCLSCSLAVNRVLSTTTCKCVNKFYDQTNNVCTPCFYSCLTCSNSTAINCITCNSAAYRIFNISTGACDCQPGYVDMGSQICQPCASSCLTCVMNTVSCSSCHSTTARYQAGYSCLCQTGYIDLFSNGTCTLCHYSCTSCFTAASTGCNTCTVNRLILSGSCLCPSGTFDNGLIATCQPCASTCQLCVNGLASGCTSCNSVYYRILSPITIGSCICQSGYYDAGTVQCLPCYIKCLSCWGLSTNCTTCDSTSNHRAITPANTCNCQIGYYQTGGVSCLPCSLPCLSCNIFPNNCTSCPSDRTLINSSGLCTCNSGTFQNLAGTCQSCALSCKTCVNSSTTCTSCPSMANRYSSGTSCPCNIGYYDIGGIVCSKCHYSCYSCLSSTFCSNCASNSFRTLQGNGSCTCNLGYYDDGANQVCSQCSPLCVSCVTYSQCLTCSSSFNRIWDSINLACPCQSGYYDNAGSCVLCHSSCATCFGVSSNSCFSCSSNRTFTSPNSCPCTDGFYDASGICTPCNINCKTCSQTPNNCTSCAIGSILSNYQCFCSIGYYLNGLTCSICDVSCSSCSISATNCLTCNPVHKTIINGSVCVCPSGKYQSANLVCQDCNPSCLTCSSLTNSSCLSCDATTYRNFSSSSFSCPCQAGYYDTGSSLCGLCISPCSNCNGPTTLNCTSCITGYLLIGSSCSPTVVCSNYLFQGQCINSCPNTTYSGLNQCLLCINNCKTCSSATLCTSCLADFYLSNGTCSVNCPNGAYPGFSKTCISCPVGCNKCSNRSNVIICNLCSPGYYLIGSSCLGNCPISDFTHVISGQKCLKCLQNCQTCMNLTSNGCLSCQSQYSLHLGMCLLVCPEGFVSKSGICNPCDVNCLHCDTKGCKTCFSGFYLNPKLACQPIGYYLSSLNIQTKCHPNCLTCTNSSFSSCLACVKYRGDSSGMAISGYCDCWKDSIDVGEGICDESAYNNVKIANEALISGTSSVNYFTALTGAASFNFFASGLTVSYQQLYANFYYLNSSAVLQTDAVLSEYGSTSFSRFMEKNYYKDSKQNKKQFDRRLQAGTWDFSQSDESLFMRGYKWQYLTQWAFITFIVLASIWAIIIFLHCILPKISSQYKTKQQKQKQGKIINMLSHVQSVLKDSVLILFHFFTINQISLYGFASFKILFSTEKQIKYLHLILSFIFFAYYFIYLIRLIVVCLKNNQNADRRQFKLLFASFQQHRLKSKPSRLYIPIIMLRSILISFFLVFFSSIPQIQMIGSLSVFFVFLVYSFFFCPYPFHLRLFVRIFQLLFFTQLLLLAISVVKPEYSRIAPAIGLLVLNFLQIISFTILGLSIILKKIYSLRCLRKQNLVKPIQNQVTINDSVRLDNSKMNALISVQTLQNQSQLKIPKSSESKTIKQQVLKSYKQMSQSNRQSGPISDNYVPKQFDRNKEKQSSMKTIQQLAQEVQTRPVEQQQITRKRYRVKREREELNK